MFIIDCCNSLSVVNALMKDQIVLAYSSTRRGRVAYYYGFLNIAQFVGIKSFMALNVRIALRCFIMYDK